MKRSVPLVIAVLLIGGIYVWWSYGNLPVYVQQVINSTREAPEGFLSPGYSKLVAHTEESITLDDGSTERTYKLAPGTSVASRVAAGTMGKYLQELAPGVVLLFLVGTTSPDTVGGLYLLEPFAEPEAGETVLNGRLAENTGSRFILQGGGTDKTAVDAAGAAFYSTVVSGVVGPALSEIENGQQLRVIGKMGPNGFVARIIDLL